MIELPDNSPVLASSAGHLGDVPQYWVIAVKEFTVFMNKYVPNTLAHAERLKILKTLTTKKIYDRLAEERNNWVIVPVVWRNPQSDFNQHWLDCNCTYLRPFLRNFALRCAHETLPTNVLCNPVKLGEPVNVEARKCILCNNEAETIEHALLYCQHHISTWSFVEDMLFQICNHRLRINEEVLYRGGFPSDAERRKLGIFLIYSTAACIWKVRNEAQKEGRRNNITCRVASYLRYEKKLQAEVDKERLTPADFNAL